MGDIYDYISGVVTRETESHVKKMVTCLIDRLLLLNEISRSFNRDELVGLIESPKIQIVPEGERLCLARINTGERCSRRPKYGIYCGAHHRMDCPDRIDVPKISLESRECEDNNVMVNLDDYIKVDHVEVDGRECHMDSATGYLYDNTQTIIGKVSEDSLIWYE